MGLLAGLLLLWGAFLDQSVTFSTERIEIIKLGEFTELRVEGAYPYVIPGAPELPVIPLHVLIPYNTTVDSIEILGIEEEVIAQGVKLKPYDFPAAPPHVEGREAQPDPQFYGMSRYPADFLKLTGVGSLRGYRLASFIFYPVEYFPRDGLLKAIKRVDFRIYLRDTAPSLYPRRTLLHDYELWKSILEGLIINKEKINAYSPPIFPQEQKGKLDFSFEPSTSGSPVSLLIIVPDEFVGVYDSLIKIKTKLGIPAAIKTTSWIYANYLGIDEAERIRNFVKDAYENWGISWLLLGADVPLVPTRRAYSRIYGQPEYYDTVATDFYFACLDGSWNGDEDPVIGEIEDDVDYYPDVFVGRLPFKDTEEVLNYINKLTQYVFNPGNGNYEYTNKFLLWGVDQSGQGDGCDQSTYVSMHIPSSVDKSLICEDSTYSPGLTEFIDSLNSGFGNVFVTAHGNPNYFQVCQTPSRNFYYAYADNLTSPPFLFDIISCDVVAFDMDCITEHMLEAQGGAIGVIGTTRLNYPGVAISYVGTRLDSFYVGNVLEAGASLAKALVTFAPLASTFYGVNRYLNMSYALLGDPSLAIYSEVPYELIVELPETVYVGDSELKVTVHNSITGEPVVGARVVLEKDSELYSIYYTDLSGRAIFNARIPSQGTLKFYVYKPGAIPFEAEKEALPYEPHLTVTEISVVDTLGDGDGIPEAGETVFLSIKLKNMGRRSTPLLRVVITPFEEAVNLLDNNFLVFPVPPGDSAQLSDVVLHIYPDITDSFENHFSLSYITVANYYSSADTPVFSTIGDTLEVDTFSLLLRAPDVQRVYTANNLKGDTLITKFYIKNSGGDVSRDLKVIIKPLLPVIPIDTIVKVDSLPPSVSINEHYPDSMMILLNGISMDSNLVELIVEDNRKIYERDTIILRIPLPPVSALTIPKFNSIYIDIRSSPDTLLMGYLIYRSESETGEYSLITECHINSHWYEDITIEPEIGYYYKVVAVDSFLNISSTTSPVYGLANPPVYLDWPKYSANAQTSSPLLADVDAEYPGTEIIITGTYSGTMIGYYKDGDKLEGWPLPIGGTGVRVYSSAAAGDIDGDGSLEVIASSLGSDKKVYAYDFEGNLVPGWPVSLESDGSGAYSSPVVYDLDGDGQDEVLITTWKGNLYIFRGDGSGFTSSDGLFAELSNINSPGFSPPAVGDIDEDGSPEIVIGTASGKLFAFEITGDTVPGFPILNDYAIRSPIVIANFTDSYPGLEIGYVAGSNLYIASSDGSILPGWPHYLTIPFESQFFGPSAADLDNDGEPEFIIQSKNGLYAFNWDGTVLSGFPVTGYEFYYSTPAVADIDGDGELEIIIGDAHEKVFAFSSSGELEARFPILITGIPGPPSIWDVDEDGKLELFITASGEDLWGFKFVESHDPFSLEWPTFLHDPGRTACYETPLERYGGAMSNSTGGRITLKLYPASPNPFKDVTTIAFSIPHTAHVKLSIYNIAGRRVSTLINGELRAGTYRVTWNGRDTFGRKLSQGVYFLTLKVDDTLLRSKAVILR